MTAATTYPASDRDRPDVILGLAGSFWDHVYDGRDLAKAYAGGLGRLYKQSAQDLGEVISSVSWRAVPLLHTEEWFPLTFASSTRLDPTLVGPFFAASGGAVFGAAGNFGQPAPGAIPPAPLGTIADAPLLFDQVLNPNACLVRDIDYTVDAARELILFAKDPFNDPRFAPQPVFNAAGATTDQSLTLWLYRAGIDRQELQNQIGYVLGVTAQSTPMWQAVVNALLDALTGGSARAQVGALLSAVCGVPLAASDGEVVQVVTTDARGLLIVTDRTVYRFPAAANALVSVGTVLKAGQSLCDAIQLDTLNSGNIPAGVTGLAVGPGLLEPGYLADVVFPNQNEALTVVTDPAMGKTKVSVPLGGFPADVQHFWNSVHARGVAAGQTLANLLDVRPTPSGEPTAASLPATLNPLALLVQSVLRCGVLLARIKVGALPPGGSDLSLLRLLRRVVPPHELVLPLLQMPDLADSATINDANTLSAPNLGMPDLEDAAGVTMNGTEHYAIRAASFSA